MNKELIKDAKKCKSIEELSILAKENNINLTKEELENYFNDLNKSGELDLEELNNVSGGCDDSTKNDSSSGVNCNLLVTMGVWPIEYGGGCVGCPTCPNGDVLNYDNTARLTDSTGNSIYGYKYTCPSCKKSYIKKYGTYREWYLIQ